MLLFMKNDKKGTLVQNLMNYPFPQIQKWQKGHFSAKFDEMSVSPDTSGSRPQLNLDISCSNYMYVPVINQSGTHDLQTIIVKSWKQSGTRCIFTS